MILDVKKSNLEESSHEYECNVCHQKYSKSFALIPCGHANFCEDCANETVKKACP